MSSTLGSEGSHQRLCENLEGKTLIKVTTNSERRGWGVLVGWRGTQANRAASRMKTQGTYQLWTREVKHKMEEIAQQTGTSVEYVKNKGTV